MSVKGVQLSTVATPAITLKPGEIAVENRHQQIFDFNKNGKLDGREIPDYHNSSYNEPTDSIKYKGEFDGNYMSLDIKGGINSRTNW